MTHLLLSVVLGSVLQANPTVDAAEVLSDKPLPAFQVELLDLAFRTASAIPLEPHVKSRSQAQDAVVAACLELGQPAQALRCLEAIENWRRGAGYADLAFYCAQNGPVGNVQRYLDLAQRAAENPTEQNPQSWQKDRILVKIARTHAWLGRTELAAALEAGVVESESGKVDAVEAMHLVADDFDAELASLDHVLAGSSFDQVRNALDACAQLFDRFYDDEQKRAQAEQRIKTSWQGKLPGLIRLELLMQLARFALDHGDQEKALELVQDARARLEGSNVGLEHQIPLQARLAGLQFEAGDEAQAKRELGGVLATFDAEHEKIAIVFRAATLRPLAEVHHSIGESATALTLYKRTVEVGSQNPNARPRAEDLSATCLSMALHGVEPDAHLARRLAAIHAQLGEPW